MKHLTIFLLALLFALQYKLWFQGDSVAQAWNLREAVRSQQVVNASLRQRNAALAAEVNDLKHGTAAIQERARLELGMIKKGETFYQFVH